MSDLRRSPIDDRHRALGATMTGFAGWDMPLDYGSVVAEHRAVREGCGAFDLSHLGTLAVTGAGAEACLQAALTNDVTALPVGRAHYSLCLDEGGGVVDDLLVYHLPWGYFVVPNAANAAAVAAAIGEHAGPDTHVADIKDDLACIALQGPGSDEVAALAGLDVSGLAYLDCRELDIPSPGPDATGGQETGPARAGVLARSGYTGERGYEVFCPADRAATLWDRVMEGGAAPAGLGCRDTLRLEMGYPLHGQDLSTAVSPAAARLGWAVKPGTGFRGEAAYERVRADGPARRLWGLRLTDRGVPRAGCTVHHDGAVVGETTSGSFSPTLRVGIALGYLDATVGAGEAVSVEVRGKALPAEVVRPPFVDADPKT